MMRLAGQVKELITRNVESLIETASNPAKMLRHLQQEIEESIIELQGEHTLAAQRIERLKAQITKAKALEQEWADKAQTALKHEREDLARQALIAREGCHANLVDLSAELAMMQSDLARLDNAIEDLEARREDACADAAEHSAQKAHSSKRPASSTHSNKADEFMSRISELEERTGFTPDHAAQQRAQASIDAELEELRHAHKHAHKGATKTRE